LKQWESAQKTAMDGVVRTLLNRQERPTSHPSYQAYGYKRFLSDFNTAIDEKRIQVDACAFLHNYQAKCQEPLLDPIYAHYVELSPLFFKENAAHLVDFISRRINRGRGLEILYEIENGKIRPSLKLVDAVGTLFRKNEFFHLVDEQKVLYEEILHTPITEEKQVIIIEGGPGTGKSVLSFNLLYGLLKRRKNVVLAAPNAAFRDVMKSRLKGKEVRASLKEISDTLALDALITGSGIFYNLEANQFDVIIVDEAHRLKDGSAYQYRGENQIYDIIRAARLAIFFIDDRQAVRPEDVGSVKNIVSIAKAFQVKPSRHSLAIQFRCAGMEGYINWVDHTLQIKETANWDSWDKAAFALTLVDSPHELYQEIAQKIASGSSARLLAGYAWPWTAQGNPNGEIDDVVIEEWNFKMPWNSRSSRTTWAIDESGIDQIGCIHTSQGLEFDYVGVIIGKDLRYDKENNRLYASWDDYKDQAGKKGLREKQGKLDQLVKNIYKVLLTRTMKGCYLYCHDREVQAYFRKRLQ